MKPGRRKGSPYRYDRATIRLVLEREGRDAALARWPKHVVDPIARILGLTGHYRSHNVWKPEYVPFLGTKPDAVLAAEWGISWAEVAVARRWLGIPAHGPARLAQVLRTARLQSVPDDELRGPIDRLVTTYGLAGQHFVAERRRRGLVGFDRRGRRSDNANAIRMFRCAALRALRLAYPLITLEELGQVFGLTRERIRQIEYYAQAEHEGAALEEVRA